MKKLINTLLFSALAVLSANGQTTTIAQWTFESLPASGINQGPYSPEVGLGSATFVSTGVAPVVSSPVGNASAKSWSFNNFEIGEYYQFSITGTGYTGFTFTWDQTGSNTGPRDFSLTYSVDGGTSFTPVTTYAVTNDSWSGSGVPKTVSTRTQTVNSTGATVLFRLQVTSTVSVNAGTVATTGTSRIDNVIIAGIAPPAPEVSRGGNTTFTPTDFGGNAFTSSSLAVFDGSSANVVLSGNVVTAGVRFATDGYLLSGPSGSDISISGLLNVLTDVNATISAAIVGTNPLRKAGNGTVTLSGNNTFTGFVGLSGGTVSISSDSALGNTANRIVFDTGTLSIPAGFTIPATREVNGNGAINLQASGALTISGPLTSGALAINNASSLTLGGVTNTPTSLTFNQPLTISITGGPLAPTTGLIFNQSSGNSTISGNFTASGTGDRTISVAGGTLTPTGTLGIGTGRFIKTGAGLLDLTSTTLTTSNATAGSFRLGVQGGTPLEGGTLRINDTTDLGVGVFQFNSGTLDVTTTLSIPTGISFGGRLTGVSRPTLTGSPITFTGSTGNNSFFAAPGGNGDLALVVNNNTTINGNFTATIAPTVALPDPNTFFIDLSGNGTLRIAGNASAVLDKFFLNGAVTLAIDGTLGGESIQVESGTTVAGNGTFTGFRVPPSGSGNATIAELYKPSSATFFSGSTLAPSGALKFISNLTLDAGSNTVLDINGPVLGSGYDSVDVSIPLSQTTITSYTLTTNGNLTLNVAAPVTPGAYALFTTGGNTTGGNVTRDGSFSAVTLTGGYSGTLSGNATTTSGNRTFTFEQSTGVLTVADTAPPLSSNANLSALSLSGVTLSPSFDPAVISYTATVANAVNNVTLFTTVQESNAVARFSSITVPPGGLGIPVSVGSNPIPVVVTAQDGTTTKTYTITLTRSLSALEAWRAANFPGSTATTGPGRDDFDFDGDGIVNLLEYATGTDAKAANTSPVTVAQVGNFLTLTYPVIADANLTYTVLGTSDLGVAFTTGAGATTGTTVKTYTDTVNLSAPGARRFLRLQVTSTVIP